MLVICDIDGTIATHSKEQRGHFDYHLVGGDAPNKPIIELVWLLASQYEVIFMTGREESCRFATIEWLARHLFFWPDTELYMRPNEERHRTRDSDLKRALYEKHIAPRSVAYVLEDRNRNVSMWRSLGLTCLQVADGDF